MFVARECLIDLDSYPDDFSPAHRRILSARQISLSELNKSLKNLLHFSGLKNIDKAAECVVSALLTKQKILIVGDYDSDGATSTALLMRFFGVLNAQASYLVPDRQVMGYGLSEVAVDKILALAPDLVITVDNGITACESVARLKQAGIVVVITDHHLPSESLPPADAIVNPNQPNCAFQSKSLAGVGVAFYLALTVRHALRERLDLALTEEPKAEQKSLLEELRISVEHLAMGDFLDLVAIGTVADCVALDYNNRILVENGLRRIREGKTSLGIRALLQLSQCQAARLSSTDIAFKIAPKINAAGRLSDISLGVDCLLTDNDRLAMDYAIALSSLNAERKTVENEMVQSATAQLESLFAQLENPSQKQDENSGQMSSAKSDGPSGLITQGAKAPQMGLCLFDADWHEGLLGILASRLKDRFACPSIILTRSGEVIKGSARSTPQINLVELLGKIHQVHPQWFISFGGHAQAAGLTLRGEVASDFQAAFYQLIQQDYQTFLGPVPCYTDGALLAPEMSLANAEFLKTFEVWGQTVPEPLFHNRFFLQSSRSVKDSHTHLKMLEAESNQLFNGIVFTRNRELPTLNVGYYDMAYKLNINEWQGQKQLVLLVDRLEACGNS